MPRILNKNVNASTLLNNIMFAAFGDHMASVEPVEGEAAELLLAIPGFEPLEDLPSNPVAASAPAALAITGTMSEDGPFNVNIPMPDGSTVNLQGDHPTDPNVAVSGDSGTAAAIADAAAGDTAAAAEQGDQAGAGAAEKAAEDKPAEEKTTTAAPAADVKKPATRKGAAK